MKDIEKLRILLPHWIEHNCGHGGEFEKWADLAEKAGESDIASLLKKAVISLNTADQALKDALELAGGAGTDKHSHSHHHDEHGHHHH